MFVPMTASKDTTINYTSFICDNKFIWNQGEENIIIIETKSLAFV